MSLESMQIEFSNETENESDKLSFHDACSAGNLKVVKVYLTQKGFDMNIGDRAGWTGFHCACFRGNLNVVQLLIQEGYDMNVGDTRFYGLYLACITANLNVVQFVLQQGFEGINEPYCNGKTALKHLINQRYYLSNKELLMPCILLLIESGAHLNKNDVFEDLISAIQNRIIEITFMKETIFEKWTGRIAQAITDYTIHPFTNTSLQNLSQILD